MHIPATPFVVRRTRPLPLVVAVTAIVAASLTVGQVFSPDPVRASTDLRLTGRGFGHGRGMGQWGSLGYAVNAGWSHDRILGHFYGGTTAGSIATVSPMSVRMMAVDGQATTVVQERGQLITSADDGQPGGRQPRAGIRVERVGPGTFRIYDGSSCNGTWTPRPQTVQRQQIEIFPTVTSDDHTEMLQLCEPRATRWLRGNLVAIDAENSQRTVNHLPMEQYLRGVVPAESPASWADAGGGAGANALRAQAVAARSYAESEGRWSYAKTCDTTSCQVYKGRAENTGSFRLTEDARTDAAVAQTAGQVRILNGRVARTEFSSSTGGYSAGGTFPAVPDEGDAVAGNPYRNWETTVSGADIERRYGRQGLKNAVVLQRNGLGADGGRVLRMRLEFADGAVDVTGEEFRAAFGLKSTWFTPYTTAPPGALDIQKPPAGGYTLQANGTAVAFGGAPAPTGLSAITSPARAIAVGGPSGKAGYVLDGSGALHPFNGAPGATPGARWEGQDVARDVVLAVNGSSGYVLDWWGGLHPFGGQPGASGGTHYTPGQDTARRVALRWNGTSGYVLSAGGGVHPFGGAPAVSTTPLAAGRTAVGFTLGRAEDRGYVVDNAGALYPFGAGGMPPALPATPTGAVDVDGRDDGISGSVATATGAVTSFGGARNGAGAGGLARRGIALVHEPDGYVLDYWGGLHAYGGAPMPRGTGYFPGRDVARRVVVGSSATGGYVLDASGGVHPFAIGNHPMPPGARSAAYWPNQNVARDIALLPGGWSGYVLDWWGGIHPFNGAPAVRSSGYWQGWDIARALVMLPSGKGGYVLDGWGGLHPFAVGGNAMPPALQGSGYWAGADIARDAALVSAGAGWTLDHYGGTHPFGGVSGKGNWYWAGRDVARGIAADGTNRNWVVYTEVGGGVHTAPEAAPYIDASRWPGQSVARDLAFIPAVPN